MESRCCQKYRYRCTVLIHIPVGQYEECHTPVDISPCLRENRIERLFQRIPVAVGRKQDVDVSDNDILVLGRSESFHILRCQDRMGEFQAAAALR